MIRKVPPDLQREILGIESAPQLSVWGSQYASPPPSKTVFEEMYHEIGSEPENSTLSLIIAIDPAFPPRQVMVKSHVVVSGAKAMRSPAYLATVRRREAALIRRLVLSLKGHRDDPDLTIWTHEPLERLRQLIQKLTEAEEFSNPEHEGNACEVLRQLRDTFLDRGWENYRKPGVCDRVAQILKRLAELDEVTADFANTTMDELFEIGLSPATGMAWNDGEE